MLRGLTPDDAHAYATLRREMLADSPWAFAASAEDDIGVDPDRMRTRLGEPGQAVVGAFDEGGRLVGVAGIHTLRHRKMAHRAHVWGVYVTPAARGQGIGERILRRVLDVARSWPGVTSVGLSVSENSPAARALYERVGFRSWGLEPGALVVDGRSYDEVHMVADL